MRSAFRGRADLDRPIDSNPRVFYFGSSRANHYPLSPIAERLVQKWDLTAHKWSYDWSYHTRLDAVPERMEHDR